MFQISKVKQVKTPRLLQPFKVPNNKWVFINMEFIVGLPNNQFRDDNNFVVVDIHRKHVHFLTTKSIMLDTNVVTLFLCDIFWIHGLSEEIVWSQLKICESNLNYFILNV
jgi:hypothetical protein